MINSKRVVAFVVARLSSSRLFGKQLKTIGDKRLIELEIVSRFLCNPPMSTSQGTSL
ncbi:cytidylyltransferase domain-containing protein [Hippea sp. KM1]|uniref:cytidylyltransferase domain-containing protein n=1 Tax=Hippea sp. KM1 TaxID=944481 RepID=UPI0004B1EFD9|nr:hypothetical protein [Hippea sp. KM1]